MYDRDRLIDAVDLPALADELLGPHRGSQRSPTWPCPNPQHAQTGRTPPVSIFRSRRGEQRWRCHGCGDGGTAIDLVMAVSGCSVASALQELAARTGLASEPPAIRPSRRRQWRTAAPPAPSAARAAALLGPYVEECESRLWRQEGAPVRRWLMCERALPEEVLRTNRIGADSGPHRQSRPDGIPRAGPAAVLPAVDSGEAVYVQLRMIRPRPDRPRFLNASSQLAPNPRLAVYRPADVAAREVVVTEGVIDALSATAAGFRAAAVLGAATTDPAVARRLARIDGPIVLALDNDDAGHMGSNRLAAMLAELRRPAMTLTLPDGINDLNDWHGADRDAWPSGLRHAVHAASSQVGRAVSLT